MNLSGLLITLVVVLGFWTTRSLAAELLVVAWLSFLMLTNAVFHITGAILDRGYVPGVATAVFLYLPYSAWIVKQVLGDRRVGPTLVAAAAVIGATPMAVHGYRILFLGTRLF